MRSSGAVQTASPTPRQRDVSDMYLYGTHKWLARHQASAAALLQLVTFSDAIVEWVCPKERHCCCCRSHKWLAKVVATAAALRLEWDCPQNQR